MILNKQLGVFLNFVHNRFKKYMTAFFQEGGYNITPEQFLLLDALWDMGVMSQQKIAVTAFKGGTWRMTRGMQHKKRGLSEELRITETGGRTL